MPYLVLVCLVEIRCKTFTMMNGKSCIARWNVICCFSDILCFSFLSIFVVWKCCDHMVPTFFRPRYVDCCFLQFSSLLSDCNTLFKSAKLQPSHADPVVGICLYNCDFCVLAGIMVILQEQWIGMPNNQTQGQNEKVLLICLS